MIKKILISSGVVIVVAGITLATLLVFKHPDKQVDTKPAPVSKKLVLDHSKDYGACTLLNTAAIQTALGDAATNLQKPLDAGITSDRYFGDGVKDITSDTQTCVYAFSPGTSTDEVLAGANGLSIKVTKYTNTAGPTALIEQTKQNPTQELVNSLGDAAFYTSYIGTEGPNATASFTLLVFKGNESISYGIIQPAATTHFTTDSAKTALLSLAK